MERKFLQKLEGKVVKIVLKNNFTYTNIQFFFNDNGLIEFEDRTGQTITCEPDFVSMVIEINARGEKNGN